jgi:hypothetical protein
MFARVKKSGNYQYLQIVENHKEKGKVKQQVIATIGRMDQLQEKHRVETLIRSLSRFSEQALLILSGKSEVSADARKIGPPLIFERLWQQTGIKAALHSLLTERKFEFDIERAVFITVLHRLMVSGSDRSCSRWQRDYILEGAQELSLHHLYRATSFLGEELENQKGATPFSPRCNKDLIEEHIFRHRRDLFTSLDLVSIPPRFTSKAAGIRSAKEALAKITARISSRWSLEPSSTIRGNPYAVRCGRGTPRMSKRCFRSSRKCNSVSRSTVFALSPIAA